MSSQDGNLNLTSKISDLKRFSEEKKSQTLLMSASAGRMPTSPSRQTSTPLLERPANRLEITALEKELEEKVRLVMDTTMTAQKAKIEFGSDFRYQPHRENMQMIKERMLTDFGASLADLEMEPWLDSYIKCECLKSMCDEVLMKFSDMLGVNSNEMGNVARKLRLTYKQSFEQMAESWKSLRHRFLHNGDELLKLKSTVNRLTHDLEHKEGEITKKFDKEIARLNTEFNAERDRDREKLLQAEYKMDQMSDTLKYLNGIFRTMQSDGSTMKNADLQSLVSKLERENKDLRRQNNDFDIIRAQLASANDKIKKLETTIKSNNDEITRLQVQLNRREDVVKQLMEREALRNAEVEKLQKISKMKDDELLSLDMKDPATSVLCIKCKKSLDDMTNIRNALMPDGNAPQKVQCENFRILLPNLRGRKPNRTTNWIRHCIRAMIIAKMKENVSLHYLRGESSRFSSFVYTWFTRSTEGLAGAALTKLLIQCDEDRWGLYYGVKALSKDDPECSVFWSLLDETFGQDGLHFILYCLSVILSISGTFLLRQFGANILQHCSSVESKSDDDNRIRPNIWVDIKTAKEAVQLILVRALSPHVQNAMDAIDALKVKPSEIELKFEDPVDAEGPADGTASEMDAMSVGSESRKESSSLKANAPTVTQTFTTTSTTSTELVPIVSEEPTHISLFMWLRVMMQQLHADQIHRGAAIRLMFETASVGALTPATGVGGLAGTGSTKGDRGGMGSANHVEYPQFLSICQTLFPHVPVTEVASLYAVCHRAGRTRVTAEIFTREADWKGYFSQAMVLPTLPLIRHLELRQREEADYMAEKDKEGSRGKSRAEVVNEATEDETNDIAEVDKELAKKDEDINPEALAGFFYNKKIHFIVRSKLATIVHRKYAGITPSIKFIMQDLPEQWKLLLKEALDQVKTSLDETYKKLKQLHMEQQIELESQLNAEKEGKENGGKGAVTKSSSSNSVVPQSLHDKSDQMLYLDGIQPYLAYRRLISLASLARSLNENPMLPSEIFPAHHLRNTTDGVSMAIVRVDKLLTHLEQSLLIPYTALHGDSVGGIAKKFVEKYLRFEHVRKALVARRLQTVYRKFIGVEIAIPRPVRMLMTPGYISNNRRDPRLGPAYPLKLREVYHEPWWAQTHLAGIYMFKLNYDYKASQLGLEPISLARAIVSYHYYFWGTNEIAEREIHDLFVQVKSYRFNIPRFRIFAAFLGDGKDLDEVVVDVLKTPQALAVYMHLLLQTHRELFHRQQRQKYELTTGRTDYVRSDSAGVRITALFPTLENSFSSKDKRDLWCIDPDVLVTVAKQFAERIPWLRSNAQYFTEIPEKLKSDLQGRVEVDDFLYVCLIQWAKLEAWHIKRSMNRVALLEKSLPSTTTQLQHSQTEGGKGNSQSMQQVASSSYNGGAVDKPKGRLARQLSVLPLTNLRSIMDSIYRANNSFSDDSVFAAMSDSQHYAASFIQLLRSRRLNGTSNEDLYDEKKQKSLGEWDGQMMTEMSSLLRDCVLWDTNLGLTTPSTGGSGRQGSVSQGLLQRGASNQGISSGQATISTFSLDATGAGSSTSMTSSFQQAAGGLASISGGRSGMGSGLPAGVLIIEQPSYVEARLNILKIAFAAYMNPFNQWLMKLSEDPAYVEEVEVRQRIQSIRIHLLATTDFFNSIDVTNNYSSQRIAVFESMGAFGELDELLEEKKKYEQLYEDAQLKMLMLMGAISELTGITGQEFPRDSWHTGVKTHLERAFVYSIHTKNSIQ